MQKRSHRLLASALLRSQQGFHAKRFELAFLFGSFQPDCNPLTYLKGSWRGQKLRGHNFSNSQLYIYTRIHRLQRRTHWTMWQYYTLGKLTHYLADAFTYPHNDHFSDSLMDHHRYESDLRLYLEGYLAQQQLRMETARRCRAPPSVSLYGELRVWSGRPLYPEGYQFAGGWMPPCGCILTKYTKFILCLFKFGEHSQYSFSRQRGILTISSQCEEDSFYDCFCPYFCIPLL